MPAVIITGSGSGLGRELALAWSSKGWRVIVTDVDVERAEQTRQMLANPDQAISTRLDVTSDEQVEGAPSKRCSPTAAATS